MADKIRVEIGGQHVADCETFAVERMDGGCFIDLMGLSTLPNYHATIEPIEPKIGSFGPPKATLPLRLIGPRGINQHSQLLAGMVRVHGYRPGDWNIGDGPVPIRFCVLPAVDDEGVLRFFELNE